MTKYRYFVIPMAAVLFAVSTVQARSPMAVDGATSVDLTEAKELFDRGVPFVDVRRAEVYYDGHIPGAVHLHWLGMFTEVSLEQVAAKDQEIVIYAWHYKDGPLYERASESCKRAVSWGFKKIYYFLDGYPGWKAAGYPLE